jgi:hypothetical protein
LIDDSRITGTNTPELTIASVQKTDAGLYDVVVTDCRSSTSAAAYLSVTCPLMVSTPPEPQSASVGDAATLSVGVSGETGTPRYAWRKNNVALQDDGFHIVGSDSATLVISPVGTRDAGGYTVVITDDCGTITSTSATLTVTCPGLVIADFDRDCDVDAADLGTFLSCASGPEVPPARCPRWPNDKLRPVADFDADGDVDQSDFGVFQRCISSEHQPSNSACAS